MGKRQGRMNVVIEGTAEAVEAARKDLTRHYADEGLALLDLDDRPDGMDGRSFVGDPRGIRSWTPPPGDWSGVAFGVDATGRFTIRFSPRSPAT